MVLDVLVADGGTELVPDACVVDVVAHPASVNNTSPVNGIKARCLLIINLLVLLALSRRDSTL